MKAYLPFRRSIYAFWTLTILALSLEVGAQNPDTTYLKSTRDSLIKKIGQYTDLKKFDSASILCTGLVELSCQNGQVDSFEYGKAILYQGRVKFFEKDQLLAETYLLGSKRILQKYLDRDKKYYTINIGCLASSYQQSARYTEANELYTLALQLYDSHFGGDQDPDYPIIVNGLGVIHRKLGNLEQSIQYLYYSIELREKKFGKISKQVSLALNSLAITYREKGDYQNAEKYFLEASEIALKVEGMKGDNYLRSQLGLATLYKNMGNYTASERILQKILEQAEDGDKYVISHVASAYSILASVCRNRNDLSAAESYYHQCLLLNQKSNVLNSVTT